MAESQKTVFEDYTHFQCVVGVADKQERNYAALQKSDRDVADLSAIRAEHAADANIPEATFDRYGYLQLINDSEVEAVSTSHTTCSKPDRFDDTQQSLADYEISPYNFTVVEQVGGEVSDSSFIVNISLTNCVSANALNNKILNSTDTSDKNNILNTVGNKLDDDDGNVANTVYSDNSNVAKRVQYNGNTNNEYDEITNLDINVYDEIATAEDGVGVYNEGSTEDSEYAEVDTRPNGVHGEGADIYNELRDTYAATDTFSSSGLLRLSSLSVT